MALLISLLTLLSSPTNASGTCASRFDNYGLSLGGANFFVSSQGKLFSELEARKLFRALSIAEELAELRSQNAPSPGVVILPARDKIGTIEDSVSRVLDRGTLIRIWDWIDMYLYGIKDEIPFHELNFFDIKAGLIFGKHKNDLHLDHSFYTVFHHSLGTTPKFSNRKINLQPGDTIIFGGRERREFYKAFGTPKHLIPAPIQHVTEPTSSPQLILALMIQLKE